MDKDLQPGAQEGKKPKNEDLQPGTEEGRIEGADDVKAGTEQPEDTFTETIAKQNETIAALLGQIDSLNAQITNYVRSTGAPASNNQSSNDGFEDFDITLKDDYVYLKDLGAEIGKR